MTGPGARPAASTGYSGIVLSSVKEFQSLLPLIRRSLPHNDDLLNPEFALAAVSEGWTPRVAVVRHGSDFAGLVIGKEKLLPGPRLGIVYADLTFGSTLLGNPLERQDTFLVALETFLSFPGTRGLRLRVTPRSLELDAVRKLLASGRLDAYFSRIRDHARLALPGTYEQLLLSFGSTTRHNFRYYRRRFEAAGHVFVANLCLDELHNAAQYLGPKGSRPMSLNSIDRLIKMAATAERPLAIGLKHRNGEWLSVICGVYRPTAGVLLLQLNNDVDFPRDSLSVVSRSYLIESLIHQGMKEFIIWAGTAPPLSRYVTYLPTVGVYIDSSEYEWRLFRGLVSMIGPLLPRRLKPDARWVAPFS